MLRLEHSAWEIIAFIDFFSFLIVFFNVLFDYFPGLIVLSMVLIRSSLFFIY